MKLDTGKLECLGQPTREQFEQARDAGCTTVINLRMPGEFDGFDEAALVAELGMRYEHIPVGGADGVTAEAARKFAAVLRDAGDCKVLAHCATSNRVGALLAVAAWQDGAEPDAAIALGKRAGLASLEPRVRELIAG
jgi:uncharacterized protein (TIGR01244 family)